MRNTFPIQSISFGERLKALMQLNNINDSLELAYKLLGYKEKPKSNTDEYIYCRKKARTIDNHLSLGNLNEQNSSVSLKTCFLVEYCMFFNCSADYLLGYINYPTHKQTDIGKETGLSPESINELVKLPKTEQYILNCLLEKYPRLPELLKRIRQTVVYSTLDKDVHITLNKENSYYPDTKDVFAFVSELNKYNLREVSSYALSQTLHEIVETLYDDEYLKELSVEYARNFIRKQISLSEAKELIDKAQKGSD